MKPISYTDYEAERTKRAEETYARHVLKRRSPDRWLIARPGTSVFWTEIVLCGYTDNGDRLVVHGDGPDLIFGRCSYRGEQMLSWLAYSSLDYLAGGKVIAGEAQEWRPEVALSWLDDAIRDADRALDDGETSDVSLICSLKQLKKRDLAELGEHRFKEEVHDIGDTSGDTELGKGAGVVPSWDLIAAREAVRTLMRLLEATDAKAVSP